MLLNLFSPIFTSCLCYKHKCNFLMTLTKDPEDILAYLKGIKPGMIVLVASFGDVTPKWVQITNNNSRTKAALWHTKWPFFFFFCGRLTDEMREVLATMGSTLIKSVKAKDNWVFAGRAGTDKKSLYEKVSEPFHCSVIFPSRRVTKQRSSVLNGAEEKQNVVIDCKQMSFFLVHLSASC